MSEEQYSVSDKVAAIFQELVQDRAKNLDGSVPARRINDLLTAALSKTYPIETADQIAFHFVDWNADAAFLIAVHLFPEKFTPEDIREGITSFFCHVPSHVIEAARLGGYSTENIFLDQDNEKGTS